MKGWWLLLPVLFLGCAHYHPDPWTKQDIVLESTWQALHLIDWGTTLDIASHPGMYEMNPILGQHPDRGRVNAYMAASSLVHLGVTHLLPGKYRPYFQAITIGMSGACVINNLSVGLNLNY